MRDGRRSHPLYSVYAEMKTRCSNPARSDYSYYGGRGISICQRWLDDFWAFVDDMGPRPEGYTLDRINPDLDYAPDNCRWASRLQQTRNRRGGSTETHCPSGHQFTKENTYVGTTRKGLTYRSCRRCAAGRARARRAREKITA